LSILFPAVETNSKSQYAYVPVDFEAGDAWWQRLEDAGFDPGQPAVVASTGVSMYLTEDAIAAMLRQVATLAAGFTLAMTFLLPLEMAEPEVRPAIQMAREGERHALRQFFYAARNAGTGPRGRLSRSPPRVGSNSHAALLCGQDRWPSLAK